MQRIVLLRHAQALKNEENRHGGDGTSLTDRGRTQARQFAELAHRYFPGLTSLQFIQKPQCHQTADIIARAGDWTCAPLDDLMPFHLGVLDGLSDEEARLKYPNEAHLIESWRLGLIEIADVKIPGASDIQHFFDVGSTSLSRLMDHLPSFLLVGTRSVLVLFWNILKGHNPRPGGYYFERPWDNSEWVEFVRRDNHWREVRTQRATSTNGEQRLPTTPVARSANQT